MGDDKGVPLPVAQMRQDQYELVAAHAREREARWHADQRAGLIAEQALAGTGAPDDAQVPELLDAHQLVAQHRRLLPIQHLQRLASKIQLRHVIHHETAADETVLAVAVADRRCRGRCRCRCRCRDGNAPQLALPTDEIELHRPHRARLRQRGQTLAGTHRALAGGKVARAELADHLAGAAAQPVLGRRVGVTKQARRIQRAVATGRVVMKVLQPAGEFLDCRLQLAPLSRIPPDSLDHLQPAGSSIAQWTDSPNVATSHGHASAAPPS
ncbi:hypothetical protein OOZ63_20720 [Paucibacter sp. PLA-PC-4]|uniref:hypothetical protein n=1 Tax=Paucibacter sp. PLA-PC-4 TaxID=2993655 RepID=UPI00224A9E25|nr:hypothetical protein [Paucibacter sp. PLA-PC-4]MCX2864256.1 hypothetical protein [Paucibacter sp. PLA-PC-4]